MPIKNNQIKQQLEVLINSPSSEEIFFLDQNNFMKYGVLRASINKLSKILSSKKEVKRFAIVTNSIASVLLPCVLVLKHQRYRCFCHQHRIIFLPKVLVILMKF